MSQKPIAKVLCLAGPTHYGVALPGRGPTDFVPGSAVLLFDTRDVEAVRRALPPEQLKVRVFPRIEDAPATGPAPEPKEAPVVKTSKKGKPA